MTPELALIGQVGVGGAFAYIIIRMVLTFWTKRKNGPKAAGELPPEFWQAEQRKAISEVVVNTIVPILTNHATILAQQTMILTEMRLSNTKISTDITVILDRFSRMLVMKDH